MTSSAPVAGRLIAAGAVILAVAQVTACGSDRSVAVPAAASGSTAPASEAGPPARAPTMTPPPACSSSTLRPGLTPTGAAAGTAYYTLRLTNVSASSCSLYGFPVVSFVTGVTGYQVGSAATRNPRYPQTAVVLAPEAMAHATLGIAAPASYPTSRCHPATAHALRVFPPGQRAAVYVTQDFPACAADVTVLTVTAVRAGRGGQGS